MRGLSALLDACIEYKSRHPGLDSHEDEPSNTASPMIDMLIEAMLSTADSHHMGGRAVDGRHQALRLAVREVGQDRVPKTARR